MHCTQTHDSAASEELEGGDGEGNELSNRHRVGRADHPPVVVVVVNQIVTCMESTSIIYIRCETIAIITCARTAPAAESRDQPEHAQDGDGSRRPIVLPRGQGGRRQPGVARRRRGGLAGFGPLGAAEQEAVLVPITRRGHEASEDRVRI